MGKKSLDYRRGFKAGQRSIRVRFDGPQCGAGGTFISGIGGSFSFTLPVNIDARVLSLCQNVHETFVWTAVIEEECGSGSE